MALHFVVLGKQQLGMAKEATVQLDENAIHSILAPDFESIECDKPAKAVSVDYPLLYDPSSNLDGHAILVPEDVSPNREALSDKSICLCFSDQSASAARAAGLPAIRFFGGCSFTQSSNRIQTRLAAFERWDAQMRAYVDAYCSFQTLLDACAENMGLSCALIDAQYRTVCYAHGDLSSETFEQELTEGTDLFRKDAVDLLMSSSGYGRMRTSRKSFPIPGTSHLLMCNLLAKGRIVGALVMYWDGDGRNMRRARFALETLAHHAETLYGRIGSFGSTSETPSLLRATLKHVLEGELENAVDISRMLVDDGHAPNARYVLLNADRSFTNEGAEGFEYLARRLELAIPGSYSIIARNSVFALVDIDALEQQHPGRFAAHSLPILLREELVKAGASRPFTDLDDLEAARVQAMAALEQGDIADPTFWCYRFDDYALAWIVAHGTAGIPVDYVTHPALRVLARYDKAHQSDLLKTLGVYVARRYNVTASSKELFVARSTLLNRLEKINNLSPIDFDNPRERTYLAISLAMSKSVVAFGVDGTRDGR